MRTLKPYGDRVVVERKIADEKSAGGVFLPETGRERPAEGYVRGIGPGVNTTLYPIKVGDLVQYSKFAGVDSFANNVDYVLLSSRDILAGCIDTDDVAEAHPLCYEDVHFNKKVAEDVAVTEYLRNAVNVEDVTPVVCEPPHHTIPCFIGETPCETILSTEDYPGDHFGSRSISNEDEDDGA